MSAVTTKSPSHILSSRIPSITMDTPPRSAAAYYGGLRLTSHASSPEMADGGTNAPWFA